MQTQIENLYSILTGATSPAVGEIGIGGFVLLLSVSLASSLLASFLYLQFFASRATGSQVHRAFPLLGISITAIFIAIQFSLPLSLGLLGALSIVRFRTPIKEPEEIGFIMLVIATSLAAATFKLALVGLIFVVAIVALVIQSRSRGFRSALADGVIVVTVPAGDGSGPGRENGVGDLLRRRLLKPRLESLSSNPDGQTVLCYNFQAATEAALLDLNRDLVSGGLSYNIFFNRARAL